MPHLLLLGMFKRFFSWSKQPNRHIDCEISNTSASPVDIVKTPRPLSASNATTSYGDRDNCQTIQLTYSKPTKISTEYPATTIHTQFLPNDWKPSTAPNQSLNISRLNRVEARCSSPVVEKFAGDHDKQKHLDTESLISSTNCTVSHPGGIKTNGYPGFGKCYYGIPTAPTAVTAATAATAPTAPTAATAPTAPTVKSSIEPHLARTVPFFPVAPVAPKPPIALTAPMTPKAPIIFNCTLTSAAAASSTQPFISTISKSGLPSKVDFSRQVSIKDIEVPAVNSKSVVKEKIRHIISFSLHDRQESASDTQDSSTTTSTGTQVSAPLTISGLGPDKSGKRKRQSFIQSSSKRQRLLTIKKIVRSGKSFIEIQDRRNSYKKPRVLRIDSEEWESALSHME